MTDSKKFTCILKAVSNGLNEPFRLGAVKNCVGTSHSFLSKHAIDPNNNKKKVYGKAYFIRVSRGLYEINPAYRKIL